MKKIKLIWKKQTCKTKLMKNQINENLFKFFLTMRNEYGSKINLSFGIRSNKC